MKRLISFLCCTGALLWLHCSTSSTEPKSTVGQISGTVRSLEDASMISPAFIFMNDSLVTSADETGRYAIASLEQGDYTLTCSALGYRDTTMLVIVKGGKTTALDFHLAPDLSTGRVLAEFQDLVLYQEILGQDPSISSWSDKEMFEGVTGATLQSKTLRRELPPRKVFLGDSLLALSDDFGQCWFNLQSGTYPLRGECDGYIAATQVVKILPNEKTYMLIFLDRVPPAR